MWDCWSKQYCSVQGHIQGSFTTAPSPKPQQPLFSTPNISNKVSTVLHFPASERHLKRCQLFEFVNRASKGCFFTFTAFSPGVLRPWLWQTRNFWGTGEPSSPVYPGHHWQARSNLISHWEPVFLLWEVAWETVLQMWSPSWHDWSNPSFPLFSKEKQSCHELMHFPISPQQKSCGSFTYMMNSISLLKIIQNKKLHLADNVRPTCFLMWF